MNALSLLLALLQPASASLGVVGSLVREATLAPGEETHGTLEVLNHGDAAREVLVYLRDYRFHADGSNDYAPPGTLPRSSGAWVTFSPGVLTVPAGGRATVTYTVRAPDRGDLDGTWWSMLMVEPAPEPPGAVPPQGVSVRTVLRYGVQLVTHLGPAAGGAVAFARGDLARVDGTPRLSVDLENAGGWRVAPEVWAEVFHEDGRPVGRFASARRSGLLPGCSARFPIDLRGLRPGRYAALVVADAGELGVFGAEYALDLVE